MKAGAPDPLAAAQRVRGLARDLAQDLADGYRRSTRYVRLRAGIVAGWAVLSLLAVWASCPSSPRTNALGAEAKLVRESIVGTQVLVENASERMWTDVALTLEGGWRYEKRTVRAGDKLVLSLHQFQKDGLPPPRR